MTKKFWCYEQFQNNTMFGVSVTMLCFYPKTNMRCYPTFVAPTQHIPFAVCGTAGGVMLKR